MSITSRTPRRAAPQRTGRAFGNLRTVVVAGAVTLLVASMSASCGTGTGRAAGPSKLSAPRGSVDARATPASMVLARTAAQAIRSGHMEVQAGGLDMSASFDGTDLVVRSTPGSSSTDPSARSAGVEMLVVGGQTYARIGDTYVRVPFGGTAITASAGTRVSDTVATVRHVLEQATVSEPGTPTTVDGVPVTRYRTTLPATKATDLVGGGGGLTSSLPDDTRTSRIAEFLVQHSTVTLVGDIEADGSLRRLEVTSSTDTSAYPDCALFKEVPVTTSIVLSGIDQPQGIEPPPADHVKDLTALDPTELLGEMAGALGSPADGSPGATGSIPEQLRGLADRLNGGGNAADPAGLDRLLQGCPG